MQCDILRINQGYSLVDGEGDAMSITIALPGGTEIQVPVSQDQVKLLVTAKDVEPEDGYLAVPEESDEVGGPHLEGPPGHERGAKPLAFDVGSVQEEESRQLEPDPDLEQVFHTEPEQEVDEGPGVAWADLPESLLSPAVRKVFTEMRVQQVLPASALAALVENVEAKLVAEANGSAQRPVGQVLPASAPRKTVSMNSAGYPMVAQAVPTSTDYDPGEVADLDEDGVAQM